VRYRTGSVQMCPRLQAIIKLNLECDGRMTHKKADHSSHPLWVGQ
jgi:hypothetical protein